MKLRKLIELIAHRPAVEFYDLSKDPYELENLAGKPAYGALIEEFSAQLKKWMEDQGDMGADMDVPVKRN